jgi:hypothetical protein
MLVPAPAQLCQALAQDAARKARQDIKGRGWKSSGALQPTYAQGEVGIRSTMKHLLYQNSGVKSFLMYWVEGRSVPMSCKQGDGPHFVRGKDVGKPGYVNIPHRGRVWRDQKWKYPGLKPKRFIESAITQAIKENKQMIRGEIMDSIMGKNQEGAKWLN